MWDPHLGFSSSSAKLPDRVLDVVNRSPLPALIIEVPSGRIVVANPPARAFLSPDGGELFGRDVESFTADEPPGAIDLLMSGRLNGFEAVRQLRLSDGSSVPIHTWLRAIGQEFPLRHALVVGMPEGRLAGTVHSPLPEDSKIVIGATDVNLVIDRVSSDVGAVLGRTPSDLIGQTIFRIVHPEDLPGLMEALAQSTAMEKGVALHIHINDVPGGAELCQMLLLPMDPLPSFAFALIPVQRSEASQSSDMEAFLWETCRAIGAVGSSRDLARLTAVQVPGLSPLSSRELEVVTNLLAGHRVPAIAKILFVSQSTVRNHLSSVFKKLGVQSQQELIDLLVHRRGETSSDK
jgi:DNA-binding CsgD family transcriptional regulator